MSNGLTTTEAPLQAAQLIFQIGTGYIASSALHVATKLTIADRLAQGPRTAAALAADTGAGGLALPGVAGTRQRGRVSGDRAAHVCPDACSSCCAPASPPACIQ